MQAFIIDVMNRFGYFGISLLIMIENLFPPIPSEVILTFSGFMTTKSDLMIVAVIVYSTIGSVAGAVVLYWLGRLLSPERMGNIIDKYGKILRLKREDVQKAQDWFNNKGSIAVLLCRFVPIVRSLISIPAGMAKMDMTVFLLYTLIGTAVWNTVLVYLGSVTGENWGQIIYIVQRYSKVALLLLFLALVIFLLVLLHKNKLKRYKKTIDF